MNTTDAYARAIDALVSMSVRPNRVHAAPPELSALHDAAARKTDEPMPMAAAKKLLASVSKDRFVMLLTGVYDPITLPYGETDGPPGVAALARALDSGVGAKPVVLCEEQIMGSIELTCAAVGLLPLRDVGHVRKRPHSVLLVPFPIVSPEESRAEANRVMDELQSTAVISVERKGRNIKGRYHNAAGMSRSTEACLDFVIDAASNRGVTTIGIGDGGNEIGMGNIIEEVRDILPYGRRCQCDCAAGIAPIVRTDLLVVANTSNLGAYGIVACMAILLQRPELMISREAESRLLDAVAAAKCMDGGFISPTVDGIGQASIAIVELMNEVVRFACG